MNNAPIGIFDSGVGGLTVARALLDQIPHEQVLYIGDSAHTPYGPRPLAQVRELSLNIMDKLVAQGVKMLVIACNSASAAVLRDARERYDVPVVEVIQPAVRRAVATTRNGRIGVIGTRATVSAGAYDDAFAAAPHLEVTSVACPRFVEFVERGEISGDEVVRAAEEYLAPLKEAGVDTLILGCTHYPLLKGPISYVMGESVSLVSSSDESALEVYRILRERGMERTDPTPPRHVFSETAVHDGDAPTRFELLSERFLGPRLTKTTTLPVAFPPPEPHETSAPTP
ncbi:glutamate racemase [Dermabacteraceae bacterium P13115]|nr:glutamate racemase [Dermabacteraceae bacterium TAE3-ERU27]MBV7432700.1 glutamate racemase [Dermabacteraceae bacterium TAE3-ERU5]